MKTEKETLFYTFYQNNSGGYFVEDERLGIGNFIIIEAENDKQAVGIFENIGDMLGSTFYEYCNCCGERWDTHYLYKYKSPMIYDVDVYKITKGMYMKDCYIHYLNGEIERVVFKDSKIK